MTSANWNPAAHPRESSGEFAEKTLTPPEAVLNSPLVLEEGVPPRPVLLGSGILRSADAEVTRKSGRSEVSNDTASVLAESLLQRLPDDKAPVDFPMLSEAVSRPGTFGPADPDKTDALHRELGSIYDRLQTAQRPRADALFTWALFGEDTEAKYDLT